MTGNEFIQKILSGERNFEGIALQGFDLGKDKDVEDAIRKYLTSTNLGYPNCFNFDGAKLLGFSAGGLYLPHATFKGATLSDVFLARANLHYASFSEAYLRNVELSLANLSNAKFHRAILCSLSPYPLGTGTRLYSADLFNTDFERANLSYVDLAKSNLGYSNLRNAELTEVNLSSANLVNARLDRAVLAETSLLEANLSDASLSETVLSRVDLRDVKELQKTKKLERAYFYEVKLRHKDEVYLTNRLRNVKRFVTE